MESARELRDAGIMAGHIGGLLDVREEGAKSIAEKESWERLTTDTPTAKL